MSPLGTGIPIAAAKSTGYQIGQSLRFNSADNAYLNRTPGSAGNRKTWTWSGWVKLSKDASTENRYFFAGNSATTDTGFTGIGFTSASNNIFVSGWATNWRITSQVFRDFSAWYHIVLVWDTTQSTANDRVKLYINGNQVTDFSTTNNPGPNADGGVNTAAVHYISTYNASANDFDGYLAEVNFIDGSALGPESFGKTNAHGVWTPVGYAGSYTSNSFYLKFASGDGTDSSGLSNTWTANNFTTSGTGTDVMSDTPTTNYATLNPLWYRNTYGLSTLSNGNLEFGDAGLTTSWGGRGSTFEISSGKWYCEWKPTDGSTMSAVLAVLNTGHYGLEHFMVQNPQNATGCWGPQQNGSYRWIILNGTAQTSGAPYYDDLDGQVVGIAIDADAGTATWYRNGTAITALTDIDISVSSKDAWVVMGITSNGSGTSFVANFGQRAFEQTAPTGYSAWNTSNLPAPTVKDGSKNFNTVLWSGNGVSGRAITGVGFQPDFLWIKRRNAAVSHYLQNSIAGATYYMFSDDTVQERNLDDSVDSFDTDGFTVGNDGGTNGSGGTYVGWNWLAGGSGSSNTDGSITSTVSANPSAGFSIVSYTGTGATASVGHGLNALPQMIIVKRRDSTGNWAVYHRTQGANTYLYLNSTAAAASVSSYWQYTPSPGNPTSSWFGVIGGYDVNASSANYIAYCFAEVEGYSKFGSYTGNGNADGPFVFCGFKPRWIMLKKTNTSTIYTSWSIYDTARDSYNVSDAPLYANVADQEGTNSQGTVESGHNVDILSNGFKLRDSNQIRNTSGDTYIFAAFAENPFGGSGVSPATAR